MFKTGKDVNYQMKRLAGMNEDYTWRRVEDDYGEYYYYLEDSNYIIYMNKNITSIVKATQEEYDGVKDGLTEDNIVSTEDSKNPIYMWYDSGVVYYYSEADIIYLNSDASYMFCDLDSVTSIDTSSFDTRKVTDMSNSLAVVKV